MHDLIFKLLKTVSLKANETISQVYDNRLTDDSEWVGIVLRNIPYNSS
jgi:hypothetical protein